MPSISGPPVVARSGPRPTFQIDPSPNRFYAVELATRWQLFDGVQHGNERADENFFASGTGASLDDASTFQVPPDVWRRLGAANRLFFRLRTSKGATQLIDEHTTTPDTAAAQAPFVQIVSLFTGEALAEAQVPLTTIWESAQQHGVIRPLVEAGTVQAAVVLHTFSPRRPFDPRAIEWVVVACTAGAEAGAQVKVGLVRLDVQGRTVKGSFAAQDAQQPIDADGVWDLARDPNWAASRDNLEQQGDLWVLSALRPPPVSTGGTAVVMAQTGRLLFKATTEWGGGGRVLVPS